MTSPVETPLLCEPAPAHASTALPEFSPLQGLGPDLEFDGSPPSSFAPDVLYRRCDRSQHFVNLVDAEISRLEGRLADLKRQAARVASVVVFVLSVLSVPPISAQTVELRPSPNSGAVISAPIWWPPKPTPTPTPSPAPRAVIARAAVVQIEAAARQQREAEADAHIAEEKL